MLLLLKICVNVFVTNLQTKCQILLYLAYFSMLTPGSLLHSTTWIFTWIYNSSFVFVFLPDLHAATGMSHLFLSVFSPPFPLLTVLWVFLDVNAAYHTGSCLQ